MRVNDIEVGSNNFLSIILIWKATASNTSLATLSASEDEDDVDALVLLPTLYTHQNAGDGGVNSEKQDDTAEIW